MRLLVVEDDLEIGGLLKRLLESNNFVVDHQTTVATAVQAILGTSYSAVIIDRMLPDGDGIDLINILKGRMLKEDLPPFLVLSALGEVEEKVMSLGLGAVDYVVKPYDPEELLARIKVCIKYKANGAGKTFTMGNVAYDSQGQHIEVNGAILSLRRRELLIFDILMRHQGKRITTHRALESAVYSYDDEICSNSLASHVSRLRKALRDSGADISLKVMRNIGYIFEVNS